MAQGDNIEGHKGFSGYDSYNGRYISPWIVGGRAIANIHYTYYF